MSVRYIVIAVSFALAFVWIGRYLETGGDYALAVGGSDEETFYEANYSVWVTNEGHFADAAHKLINCINDFNHNQELEAAGRQTDESHRAVNYETTISSDKTSYGSATTGDLHEYNVFQELSANALSEKIFEAEGMGGPENARNGESAENSTPWREDAPHFGETLPETGEPVIPAIEAFR